MILDFYKKYEINILIFTRFQLLNLSFYLGHKKQNWLKIYNLYITGFRLKFIIFNLDYTLYFLNRALCFFNELIYHYGKIFSLSNFRNLGYIGLGLYFLSHNMFGGYYDGKYFGGLISNFLVIQKMKKINKNRFLFNYKIFRKYLPSLILIFDAHEFFSCFYEALYLGIANFGIIDLDMFLACIYPIFGNTKSFFFTIYILIYLFFSKKKSIFLRKLRFYIFLLDICRWILIYKIYILYIKYKFYNKLIEIFKKFYDYTHDFFYRTLMFDNQRYTQNQTFFILKKLLLIRVKIFIFFLKKYNKKYIYQKYMKKLKKFFLKRINFLNELSVLTYFYHYEKFETAEDQFLKLKIYNEFDYVQNINNYWNYSLWQKNLLSNLIYRYYLDDSLINYYDNWFKKIAKRLDLSGFIRYTFKRLYYLRFYKLYLRQLSFIFAKRYLYILVYKILKRRFKIIAAKILLKRHRKLKAVKYFYKRHIFQLVNILYSKFIGINYKNMPVQGFYQINYKFYIWTYVNKYYLRLLIFNRCLPGNLVFKYRNYIKSYIKKVNFQKMKLLYNKSLKNLWKKEKKMYLYIMKQYFKINEFTFFFILLILKSCKFKLKNYKKKFFFNYKKNLNFFFFNLNLNFFYKLLLYRQKKYLLYLIKRKIFGIFSYNETFLMFLKRYRNIKNIKTRIYIAKKLWYQRRFYVKRLSCYFYRILLLILFKKYYKWKFKKYYRHLII